MTLYKRQSGFTLIELLIVIVVIGILVTLIITTNSGIQQKNRNTKRQTAITDLQAQLEAFFAQKDKYPTLANFQDRNWIKSNMKKLDLGSIQDPSWSLNDKCTGKDFLPILAASPTAGCYSYQPTTDTGAACDNASADCTKYTITATNEGGGTSVKTSLN